MCLTRLDVSNNPIKNGTKAFRVYKLNNLKILQLNNCGVDDESFLYLVEGIKNYTNLNLLEINNNSLTEYSTKTAAIFFQENHNLINFYILNNPLCKRDLTKKLKDSDLVKIISEI